MEYGEKQPRRKRGRKVELTCDCGCGTIFYRYRNKIRYNRNYFSRQHQASFERGEYLQEQCGPYLGLVTDYLEGAARQRYRNVRGVGNSISPFFRYLCAQCIGSIQEVEASTITAFQVWARGHGYASASKDISALSVFFQWAIVEEHYSGENPVIPAVHGKRNKARSGRPYSEQEMTNMRLLLNERGNERLRAFFEIASESGLRKSELSRLVLGDISLDAQRVKVRLPNKGMRERTAFFSDRAATRIREWLAVRDMQCGHEFFFHNCMGGKLQGDSIPNEFKRALCKTYRDRVVNEEGLETFSIHRLRHTLTSNLASGGADATTLMTCLGWVSPSSVDGYMKLSEHAKVTGFVNAMAKVDDQVADGFGKRVLAPEEFLLLAGENAAWNQGW